MKSCFRDQCVVVFCAEHTRRLQCRHDRRDRLQLRVTLRYTLFVNSKRFNKEFVCEIFDATLIGHLSR